MAAILAPEFTSQDIGSEDLKMLLSDPRFVIETFMKIRTETKGVQPFIFNSIQADYYPKMSLRDIILKSRRIGFSTLIDAVALIKTITHEGYIAQIVVHDPAAATTLFENLRIMFLSLPEWLRPKVGFDNRYELTFPELASRISVTTSGKDSLSAASLGKGGSVNFLHCSEFAVWPLPMVSMGAILPCVPIDGTIVIESTAQGYNNFWSRWKAARNGTDIFKTHFYAWIDDPKCKLKLKDGEMQILKSQNHPDRLTREEKLLIAKYNITLEQIKWRRWKIAEIGASIFPQEYPIDEFECFLQSGRPFFNVQSVQSMIEDHACPPKIKRWEDGNAVPNGWLVYDLPQKGEAYIGGVDAAEGLAKGDLDDVTVLNRKTGEEVLHISGRFGPELLARQIAHAHVIYGKEVYWGVERNNHGHTVLHTLLKDEMMPKRYVYHHADWDEQSRRVLRRPGWNTDGKSRPLMLDEVGIALAKRHLILHDPEQLQQFLTFVHTDSGKPEAEQGSNDDGVISAAIAWQMRKFQPFTQQGWT